MKNKKRIMAVNAFGLWVVLAATVGLTPTAPAQIPQLLDFQGRLTDNTPQQNPVDATLPMEFRIYGSLLGSDLLWSESWASVDVVDGIFSVLLGSDNNPIPSSVFSDGGERYVEVIVDGETLSPRQQIGSVSYAMLADRADQAGDVACEGCVSATEVDIAYAASASQGGAAVDLACADCVGAGEVQFNYASSGAEAGAADDVDCTGCITSAEISDVTIVDADIAAAAAIAPDKISGTAWTSTNDGAGTGLDADLVDGLQPRDLLVPAHHAIGIGASCASGSLAFANRYGWIFVSHSLKDGNEICARYGLSCTEVIKCVSSSGGSCTGWSTGMSCTTTPNPGRYWPTGSGAVNGDAYACCQ